jgi:hypothetical protein
MGSIANGWKGTVHFDWQNHATRRPGRRLSVSVILAMLVVLLLLLGAWSAGPNPGAAPIAGDEQIQPFAEEFQMTLPVVRDTDGVLRNLYEVRGMPTSVFIDREGKISTIWTGVLTSKLLQEMLAEMG